MIFLASDAVKHFHSCTCGAPLAADGKWTVLEGDVQSGIRRLCPKCIEKSHRDLQPVLADLDAIGVAPPLNYGQRIGIVVGATSDDVGRACSPLDCQNVVKLRRFEQCLLPMGGVSTPYVWCEAHRDERVANEPLTTYLHKLNGTTPYIPPAPVVPPPPSAEEIKTAKRESIRMDIARALALQTETGQKISPYDGSVMLMNSIEEMIADATR